MEAGFAPHHRRPDPARPRHPRRRARAGTGAHRGAASPGCSSAASRRTRPSTTSSRRSPRTAGSTTPTRGLASSSAADARTATPARSSVSSTRSASTTSVTLTGGVSPAELAAYYRAADVFVVCSEHEGFCVPLLEAMHHGVPIVAFASTAVPETLGDAGPAARRQGPVHVRGRGRARRRRSPPCARQLIDAGARRVRDFDLSRTGPRVRRSRDIGGVRPRPRHEARGRHPALRHRGPGRRRDRRPPPRDPARDPPGLHGRGAHDLRARRRYVGRPLPERDHRDRRREPCTASRSRGAGAPTSTRAPISSSGAAGGSTEAEQRSGSTSRGRSRPL